MNVAIGVFKLEDHFDELERRIRELAELDAFVGVTDDGMHPDFDGTYHELMWMLHAGVSEMNIPPRPLASVAMMTFKGENILKRDLDRYFKNLDKRSSVSAQDTVKPFLMAFYDHSKSIFGDTTFLEPNAQYTIDIKGFDAPLVDSGSTKATWGIKINDKRIK